MVHSLLPRPVSDHSPIFLDGNGLCKGLIPFKFENMWLKMNGFKELINNNWGELQLNGSASFKLVEKLKALKLLLKRWNRDEVGNVHERKVSPLSTINSWDSLESNWPLTWRGEENSQR